MAQMQILVKQPAEFEFGDDFGLFYDRFMAFIRHSKCEVKSQYNLFLSYLDDTSFKKLRAVQFTNEHKTENVVDLEKALPLLKITLTKTEIPLNVQLRYRTQKPNETLSDFGEAIRSLGQLLYGTECETNSMVIETFCIGIIDSGVSAKMLQKTFDSLADAIKYARARKQNTNIKNFLVENRSGPSNVVDHEISVLPANVHDVSRLTRHHNTAGQSNSIPQFYNRQHNVRDNTVHSGAANFQNSRNNFSRETRTCYYCNRVGHIQKFCPDKGTNDQDPQKFRHVVCHRCHKKGHIRKFCPMFRENSRNRNFR